ncbi:dual serine/threonine and tyrosine protein kinase-like isoform X2 [Arctopsyche grandis]|uniref:dual serine/threonine and tyrosine protein kinase-like isoform X2 n=1 Tax=Arctopsyche grandis TaxID=121162 RepID=UPI00406D9F22
MKYHSKMAKRGPKDITDPADGLDHEVKRFNEHRRRLSKILGDTQKALRDVTHLKVFPLESAIAETIRISVEGALRPTAYVVLGTARARIVNFLLGDNILPLHSKSSSNSWRWLRLQYGEKRQIRLSLGTEFEVVDPNLSLESNWDQIPSQTLRRNNTSDLSTVMDIELNNRLLKSGIQILVPPDLGELSLNHRVSYEYSIGNVMRDYEAFYSKWNTLLDNVFPIVLYSLDELRSIETVKINDNVSRQPNCSSPKNDDVNTHKSKDKVKLNASTFYIDSDELNCDANKKETIDTTFNVSVNERNKTETIGDGNISPIKVASQDLPLLGEENLLDLRQIFELHSNTKILFILFSDSTEKLLDKKISPNTKIQPLNDGLKTYSKDSVDTASPSSFFTCENSSFSSTSTSLQPDLSCTSDDSDTSSEEKFEDTDIIKESQQFSPNDDTLLMRQKTFLAKVVQQLELLSIPFLNKSLIGQGIVVNDNTSQLSSSTSDNDVKKSKTIKPIEGIFQRNDFIRHLVKFSRSCFQSFVVNDCQKLSEMHNTLIQQFILSSFDMAREMQIIPRKIKYVSEMEQQLYNTLLNKFSDGEKREELLSIMQRVLQDMKNHINSTDWAGSSSSCHSSSDCINLTMPTSVFYTENVPNDGESSSTQIETPFIDAASNVEDNAEYVDLNDYDIITNSAIDVNPSMPPTDDVVEANEETFTRLPNIGNCHLGNENNGVFQNVKVLNIQSSRSSTISFKQASLDVQRMVLSKISRNISIQLVKFVDCMRHSYFGTLQRCLDSLEEGRGKRSASEAIRQILLVTRTVDLQHCASFSFLHALVDHLRRFFHRARWRRQMALDTVESLSASKLEKIISTQLKEKLKLSHEKFQSALYSLDQHHNSRLVETEELKFNVRKLHAPRFARLCLESTSLGDYVRFGLPRISKEIGRGQYGIVFSVKGSWAGYEPCAVKSVVPPDDRHFNELAMEFFQTRNIPIHDRIVRLWGSVIDYTYAEENPSVLLISERLKCDLLCALSPGKIKFSHRMQIAVDIVEGIRYLHSQGLVHRDIKLKNVLLDEHNRAKLTDLGFCMPGAMMSGSIVGTPVHMAPELLSGSYDNSVDVYAFGILFWYVCSGNVRLPAAFERFQNKEQLWTGVKRGLRPERLPNFSDTCWLLMEKCWAAEPCQRPLLGDVQPILESVRDNPHPGILDHISSESKMGSSNAAKWPPTSNSDFRTMLMYFCCNIQSNG